MEKPVTDHVLAPGPGLTTRWVLATPLLLLATVVPGFGNLVLAAWISVSFQSDYLGGDATFWGEFGEYFGNIARLTILPAVVLLVFLVRRSVFATWPKACLWLAVWMLVPSVLMITLSANDSIAPNIALSLGLVWLNYELGRLALWVLSRPVARDVTLSSLEIPYKVPNSRARLRIQRDRLLLDNLHGSRRLIPFTALRDVRLSDVPEPSEWLAGRYTKVRVPAGPALHIESGTEKWVLPVPEPLGEELVAAITLRAGR